MIDNKQAAIEQDQIAWTAFEHLRSGNPDRAIGHTVALLVLKLFSDLSLESGDRDFSTEEWPPAWRNLQFPRECDWPTLCSRGSLAKNLDNALAAIASANPVALGQVFDDIQFERLAVSLPLGNQSLQQALSGFSQLNFRPSQYDDLSRLISFFERFAHRILDQAQNGSFEVPRELSILLVQLLDPKPNESILDPACGSGLLLSQMATHAAHKDVRILGQNINFQLWALCKMNLLLQGVTNEHIVHADALRFPLTDKDGLFKADIVISNPPFSLKLSGPQELKSDPWKRFWRGLPPSGRADYAFLSHIVEATREGNGRAGVIVPHGVLFRAEESAIRRSLIEENILAAVITLPHSLFQQTRIAVALLIFDKAKKNDRVLFVDASRNFSKSGKTNQLTDEGINRIRHAFRSNENISGFSYLASLDEIRARDHRLGVPLYVEPDKSTIPREAPEALLGEIRSIEEDLRSVRNEIQSSLENLDFDVP